MQVGESFVPWRVFVGSVIPNCVIRMRDLTPAGKVVLARMMTLAGDRGLCYASESTLAAECGMSVRGIRYRLEELEAKAFIVCVGRRHRCNVYEFLWHSVYDEAQPTRNRQELPVSKRGHRQELPVTDEKCQADGSDDSKPARVAGDNRQELPEITGKSCLLPGAIHVHDKCTEDSTESSGAVRADAKRGDALFETFYRLLVPGVPTDVDMQELGLLIEDHGRQRVLDGLRVCADRRIRRRGVLPYLAKVLRTEGQDETVGDMWR